MHVLIHVWGHGVGGVVGSIVGGLAGVWLSTPPNCTTEWFIYRCHLQDNSISFLLGRDYYASPPEGAWLWPAVIAGVIGVGVAHAWKLAREKAG
jgi:hypothetical protein